MKPKIIFFSRYQHTVSRGAETFVSELSLRLEEHFSVKVVTRFNPFYLFISNPDILIPVNGGAQSLLCKIYCLIFRKKLIISGQAGLGRPDKWNLLLKPDAFVAVSKRNAAWAQNFSPSQNIPVIPNGVDLAKFNPQVEPAKIKLPKPIILCVAGPESYKNVSHTIQAIALLPKASLLLLGGSKQDNRMGRKLLGDRFIQAKYSHEDMPAIYRAASIFTLASSTHEAFGIAYLEALACGLPIVATDDDLRREILGKHAIYIDSPQNHRLYGDKLSQALVTKPQSSTSWLASYTWDHVANLYTHLCSKLLS